MPLESPPFYRETKIKPDIEEYSEVVRIEAELIKKADFFTVQPWVELYDVINDKIVRIRVINNGKSPEEMIKHFQNGQNKPTDNVKYTGVRLEIDEEGKHRIYFNYLTLAGGENLPTKLLQTDLQIVDNRIDKNKLPGKYTFSNEEFNDITTELSYVCMDTLPMTDIVIDGKKQTCIGLTRRANKPGVVYGDRFWLWGGKNSPKGDIVSGGLPTFMRETKLAPEKDRFNYVSTNLARYNNSDTPEKPFKTTINVTYSLKLSPEEAAAIKLDLKEYAEPMISWIPIDEIATFVALAYDYQFNPYLSDSSKRYKRFMDTVGKFPIIQNINHLLLKRFNPGKTQVAHTWRLPRYDLQGKKLGDMDINPFDEDYKALFVVLDQFLMQIYTISLTR